MRRVEGAEAESFHLAVEAAGTLIRAVSGPEAVGRRPDGCVSAVSIDHPQLQY